MHSGRELISKIKSNSACAYVYVYTFYCGLQPSLPVSLGKVFQKGVNFARYRDACLPENQNDNEYNFLDNTQLKVLVRTSSLYSQLHVYLYVCIR